MKTRQTLSMDDLKNCIEQKFCHQDKRLEKACETLF